MVPSKLASTLFLHLLSDGMQNSLPAIALDKGLAKLGDILTNLIYSLAKSSILQVPTGVKVSGKVLAAALRLSGLRDHLPTRLTLHQRSDAAEAIIAYLWISQKQTIPSLTDLLLTPLSLENFTSKAAEDRGAIIAFTQLFTLVIDDLPKSTKGP